MRASLPLIMAAQLTGFYINLDRTPDRAAYMQAQLARLGLAWVQRHRAVDAADLAVPPGCPLLPAEVACFLSHLQVLQRAPADAHVLVLEDDTELSDQLLEIVMPAVRGGLPGVDIVFLECQPHISLPHVSALWTAANKHFQLDPVHGFTRRISGVELLDAGTYYRWGCPAYVVTPHGRARLVPMLEAWLRHGPQMPIDRHFEAALAGGQLRGAITMPFLATTGLQWHGRSTIGNGYRMPHDAFMLVRRVLYAGSLQGSEHLAQALAAQPADAALDALAVALRIVAAWQRIEAHQSVAPPISVSSSR